MVEICFSWVNYGGNCAALNIKFRLAILYNVYIDHFNSMKEKPCLQRGKTPLMGATYWPGVATCDA